MLLTLDEAKLHMRVDDDVEDQLIQLYLGAAERAVADFLNREIFADQQAIDDAGEAAGDDPLIATDAVRAAVMLITGHLYAHREDVVVGKSMAELPHGAVSLLWPYRVGIGV